MSTKTTFKRVALVAAASLGLGLISAVPAAQAAMGAPAVVVSDGTVGSLTNYDSSTEYATFTITGTAATVATDSVSVTILNKTVPATAVQNEPTIFLLETSTSYAVETRVDTLAIYSARVANSYVKRTSLTTGALAAGEVDSATTAGQLRVYPVTAGAFYAKFGVALDSGTTRKAGTYTYQIGVTYPSTNSVNTTTYYDVNLVVSAAASASKVASPLYSTAYIQQTASASVSTSTASDSVVAIPSYSQAATTDSASIVLTLKNASNVAAAAESVTVTTTLGLIQPTGGASQGKSLVLAYTAGASLVIGIKGDGTAGSGTVTITTASTSFSKTFTLYSTAVSKIVGTKRLNTLAVGDNAAAITAVATDSLGNQNGLSTGAVHAYSSDTTIVSTYGTACAYSASKARQECTLVGVKPGTVTITLRNASTVATSTVSDANTYTVTVGNNAPATLKMALNKTSYAPGEKGYLFIWAADSAGNPVSPQTVTNLLSATGVVVDNQLGSASDTLTGYTTTSGVSLALAQKSVSSNGILSLEPVFLMTFYAPLSGAKVTFTATGGTGLPAAGQVAVSVSADISNDAATALAAVTALASQVSAFITKINAQITTLTDLVMKIQKKVKA